MHMRVERIEARPEPIVDATVVVPSLAVGHCAIERKMRVELRHLRDQETRAGGFKPYLLDRLAPSIESVVKPQL